MNAVLDDIKLQNKIKLTNQNLNTINSATIIPSFDDKKILQVLPTPDRTCLIEKNVDQTDLKIDATHFEIKNDTVIIRCNDIILENNNFGSNNITCKDKTFHIAITDTLAGQQEIYEDKCICHENELRFNYAYILSDQEEFNMRFLQNHVLTNLLFATLMYFKFVIILYSILAYTLCFTLFILLKTKAVGLKYNTMSNFFSLFSILNVGIIIVLYSIHEACIHTVTASYQHLLVLFAPIICSSVAIITYKWIIWKYDYNSYIPHEITSKNMSCKIIVLILCYAVFRFLLYTNLAMNVKTICLGFLFLIMFINSFFIINLLIKCSNYTIQCVLTKILAVISIFLAIGMSMHNYMHTTCLSN